MKKMILFGLLAVMASCSIPNERLVKKEFLKYVRNNFDDPKSLKEVVLVEINDTVSLSGFVEITKQLLSMIVNTDSLCSAIIATSADYFDKHELQINYYSSNRYSATSALRNMFDCIQNESKYFFQHRALVEKVQAAIDSVKYEAPLYGYKIKFRRMQDKELKIMEYSGYVDSLSRKVVIYPQSSMPIKETSSEIYKFKEYSDEICEFMKNRRENIQEFLRNHENLKKLAY